MHLDILDENRKRVFEILKSLNLLGGFTLGGGTALALQMGHRVSVDFDFFSENLLEDGFLERLEKELMGKDIEVTINSKEELTFFLDGVKVTFLSYPFPTLLPSVDIDGVKALSILEIATTKAYTIGRRSDYKDYVDLYFLLKDAGVTLGKIIELCKKKYGGSFNSRLFLEQLVFEKDIEEVDIKFVSKPVSKKEIFSFFESKVSQFQLDF